ncbi:hypothetical protein [Pseudomonas sp. Leaf48]|uniref:hypothetical protein n=1 Tax=Pseudomonas sp. Leaf48 TaxID=1736221 RepID=UPI0009EC9D9D|nr:hypothetical protein [Pseudomonas sp. Leaf48]
MVLKAVVLWVLLSIVVVAVLCRLVHNAKVADRALKRQALERKPVDPGLTDRLGHPVSRSAHDDPDGLRDKNEPD